MKKSDENSESLLQFPCDFTIKIVGRASEAFEVAALSIITKHVPNMSDRVIQSRDSGKGNYKALSITIHVESREQLDQIYIELSSSPEIIMVL